MAEHAEDPEAILADLDFDLDDESDAQDFSQLSSPALLDLLADVKAELQDRNELYHPNPPTERGRELHNMRAALLVEQARRGLR